MTFIFCTLGVPAFVFIIIISVRLSVLISDVISSLTYAEASLKYTRRLTTDKTNTQKTRILPALV